MTVSLITHSFGTTSVKNPVIAFAGLAAALLYSPLTMATPTTTLNGITYSSAVSTYYDNGEYRLFDEKEGIASSAIVGNTGQNLSTYAWSSAQFGTLKNEVRVTGGPEAGIVNASSTSYWVRQILFSNPDLVGQKGYATLQHQFSSFGGMDYGADARSTSTYITGIGFSRGQDGDIYSDFDDINYRLTIERTAESFKATQEYAENRGRPTGIEWRETAKPYGAPNNFLYLPIEFIWGETYYMFASQTTECSVVNSGAGSSACRLDASRSAYWGGVTDVRTESGDPVPNFALMTVDGENITQSLAPAEVPEPGSALLACTGLGMAWLARRRPRKARP